MLIVEVVHDRREHDPVKGELDRPHRQRLHATLLLEFGQGEDAASSVPTPSPRGSPETNSSRKTTWRLAFGRSGLFAEVEEAESFRRARGPLPAPSIFLPLHQASTGAADSSQVDSLHRPHPHASE